MAINVVTATQVSDELGVSRWIWIPLIPSGALGDNLSIPYAEIPDELIPSTEFQTASETSTCTLIAPWGGFTNAFDEFLGSGGNTGGILGALSGLSVIEQSFSQKTTANYGLGQEYLGPEFGYCMGTLFKEKIYSSVNAQFSPEQGGVFVGESNEDLIWRSKFERFYLNHGFIRSFSEGNGFFTLSIDTNTETTSVETIDFSAITETITLYKKVDGSQAIFSVNEVRGVDGGIEIDVSALNTVNGITDFQFGDYFVISSSWLIQDPYLLDGLMNNISNSTLPTGSSEFFRTIDNSTFSNGSFTGIYIRKRSFQIGDLVELSGKQGTIIAVRSIISTDLESVPDNTIRYADVDFDDGTSETDILVSSLTLVNESEIDMPVPNTDMINSSAFTWYFYPITSGSETSEIYSGNIRYIVTQNIDDETGSITYTEEPMEVATDDDYNELINNGNITYFKTEISDGGKSTRTNFHDGALINTFIIQENSYYDVVGQEGGHIIDISLNDIAFASTLDPKAKANYDQPNEFGWKTVEWYMSNSRTKFLQGTVTAISGNSISVQVSGENTATAYAQRYSNQGTRETISFFDRFTQTYGHDITSSPKKLYSKFKGWYTFNNQGASYEAKNITIDPNRSEGSPYEAVVEVMNEPTDFTVGDTFFVLFDKSAYGRTSSFNGTYLMDVTQTSTGNRTENAKICLDGFWLSPTFTVDIPANTRLGLCGGRYWGLGDIAPDNNNAIIFMRSAGGILGLSTMFYDRIEEDWVLFYDHHSRNLCIRRGAVNFSESPKFYEVSIGNPSSIEDISSTNGTLQLDETKERTKSFTLNVPNGDGIILFKIGEDNNYYGTIIGGQGKMNLKGFSRSGIDEISENYKYYDEIASPTYEYEYGKYSREKAKKTNISIGAEEGPLIIESSNGSPVISGKVAYINEEQIINNANLFDLHITSDDEIFIIMGRGFKGFTVDNPDDPTVIESNSGDTAWTGSSNGVFIISSRDNGETWGNPQKKSVGSTNNMGLLVLNDVDYCCSIYEKRNETLTIFAVAYDGGVPYFSAFIISLLKLSYVNYECSPSNGEYPFSWRPPAFNNPNFTDNPVVDNFEFNSDAYGFEDRFTRIFSQSSAIDAQLVASNVTDFGIVSSSLLNDGTIVVFYDSEEGVQLISSNSSGEKWQASEIIVARNAQGGIYDAGVMFYITEEGIESKIVPEPLLNSAMSAVAGSSDSFLESIQESFDSQITTSLNTGPVPLQKLAGHEDDNGIYHIFFYDDDKKLRSVQGTDLDYKDTDNF